MKYLLPNNRANFKSQYKSGLSSQLWVPLNNGRSVGPENNLGVFKNRPATDSVKLTEWISYQIANGNITVPIAVDDNGIITYLPLGDVNIDSATNSLGITNATQFTFNLSNTSGIDIGDSNGRSHIRLGDYNGADFGLSIDLNDDTGALRLGDTTGIGAQTVLTVDDFEATITLDGDLIVFGGASYTYEFPSVTPAEDGSRYYIVWRNGNPSFKAEVDGIYTGSGGIFTDALATVNNTFTIKSDSSPVTIQTLWDDSTNAKTWSTTTRTQFDDRRSFISIDSKYDNSASSTITLSATNDSSTGTITVEEDNITFSAGVLGQTCSLDDNGFSIQVDGGNYYFPGWQPTALANHYIQTWVSGSPQWQRLAIGPGYANDGAAAAGGVAIGQIYLNTTNNAMHVRLT